jgi:hypothetical protein
MSFQTFVTERLKAITETLNAIGTNAKKIDELPVQSTLDPASKIHVSKGGTSESLEVQKIIDAITEKNYSQLLAIGEITVSGLNVIVPAAMWVYEDIIYQTTAITTIPETLCAAGYLRKDILVANQSNQIILVKGAESETIRIKPNIPIGTVFVTEIDVDDVVIGTPSTPIVGDNFISKVSQSPRRSYDNGIIDLENETRIILYTCTEINYINHLIPGQAYDGRQLFITNENEDESDIVIDNLFNHKGNFSFANGIPFVLKFKETIHTKLFYDFGNKVTYLYVGVFRNQISDITGLTEALDAIAPDGLVKEGVISMTGLNASIAAEDFEWRINHIIYKNSTLFTDTLPATTTGYMRTDIFEGDDNGDIFRKQGNEAIGASLKPSVTIGRIELGSIDIENSTASTPVIPKPKWAVSQQLRDGETGYSPSENVVYDALALKVDKVTGKGLSTEDYTTSEKNKLASIDATHYLAPLQTTVQLSAMLQSSISDKARVYVENDLSDYFYDATAVSGDIAPDDQAGGIGFWRKVAVGGETAASIKTKYESNADTNAFTNSLKAKLDSITEIFTTALKTNYDSAYNWISTNGAAVLAHISSAHAPANAQKNSDITKAEIEAKLIGEISSHTHPAVGGGVIVDISSGTYQLLLTDSGKSVVFSNATSVALTIPTNATVAFPIGTKIDLTQQGNGVVTLITTGLTIISNSPLYTIKGQTISVTKTAINTWSVIGNDLNGEVRLLAYPNTRNDGANPTNKVLSTDASGNLKFYTMAVMPAPYLEILIPDSTLPAINTNVILKGSFFTPTMTVSFGSGATVNSTTFISDNRVNLNITTSATEGNYSITLNNGVQAVFPNALLVVLGTVYEPIAGEWEAPTGSLDVSEGKNARIVTFGTFGSNRWNKILDYSRNFSVRFRVKRSPLGYVESNGATTHHIAIVNASDNSTLFSIWVNNNNAGTINLFLLKPDLSYTYVNQTTGSASTVLDNLSNKMLEYRYISGVMKIYIDNALALTLPNVFTGNMKFKVNLSSFDVIEIKYIELA